MDPVGDFLIRIKNGYSAGKHKVVCPASKIKEKLARLLVKGGYLADFKIRKISKAKREIIVGLRYNKQKEPALKGVKRLSRPGRRVMASCRGIPWPVGKNGITIVSTSEGLMTGEKAKKRNLGGEIIGQVW